MLVTTAYSRSKVKTMYNNVKHPAMEFGLPAPTKQKITVLNEKPTSVQLLYKFMYSDKRHTLGRYCIGPLARLRRTVNLVRVASRNKLINY